MDSQTQEFRAKQMRELEQLQIVLDENGVLRSKINAIQTQVVPLVDTHSPAVQANLIQYQSDKVYTPEELESIRFNLEQLKIDYKNESLFASHLNSEIEKLHTQLSTMKRKNQADQDQILQVQNLSAEQNMAAFKNKSDRQRMIWQTEKNRIQTQILFLKKVQENSLVDISEFEEQQVTNQKGITQLSGSIANAKEDIREFLQQTKQMEYKMKEYENLKVKHTESEAEVVQLSDELENLKREVETTSLTAQIRRQIDDGNKKIEELNRDVDKLQCYSTAAQERNRETSTKLSVLVQKITKTQNDSKDLLLVYSRLENQKQKVLEDLKKCRRLYEEKGGENHQLQLSITDSLKYEPVSTVQIRKHMRELKDEVEEISDLQLEQIEFEENVKKFITVPVQIPSRKRVPMIPLDNSIY